MSMHEIEDLVEESARLVLASSEQDDAKLRSVLQLYRFQAWFDTGETTGRLKDELDAIGYFDAPEAEDPALLPLAARMMGLADSAGDVRLVHHWLAVTVDAISDLALGPLVPSTFDEMLDEGSGQVIRETAVRNEVLRARRKGFFMRLPRWSDVKSGYGALDPDTLEKRHILRYLLDHATTPERIAADRKAEEARIAKLADAALFSLPERVPAHAPLVFLGQEDKRNQRAFVFAESAGQPGPDEARLFFVIEHDSDLNLLACEMRVQSGLLSRWQGAGGNTVADTHFRLNYALIVPDEELSADKDFNAFGGWKFRIDQSAKVLEKRLESIFGHWGHIEKAFAFHRKPLREVLASSTPEKLESRRRKLREKHGFFVNDIELLFANACLEWESGRRPDSLIAEIERNLAFVHDMYPLRSAWADGLEKLRNGIHFPPMTQIFAYRRLGS